MEIHEYFEKNMINNKQIKIKYINLDKLSIHPLNDFDPLDHGAEWDQFVESIRKEGILHPLVVDKNFQIYSGQRRYLAASILKMKEAPCIIDTKDRSEIDQRFFIIDMNLTARNYTDRELTRLFNERYEEEILSQLRKGENTTSIKKDIIARSGLDAGRVIRRVQAISIQETQRKLRKFPNALEKMLEGLPKAKALSIRKNIDLCLQAEKKLDESYRIYRSYYNRVSQEIRPVMARLMDIRLGNRDASEVAEAIGGKDYTIVKNSSKK